MTRVDIDLLDVTTGSISAPAGCGKTHLITEAIRLHQGVKPILVLTHTNAGVAALRGRLERSRIASSSYRVFTIDGWVMRMIAMFPESSGHDANILKLTQPNRDYPAIRQAAGLLLAAGHLDDAIGSTYAKLIVDEYQDCSVIQHGLVCELSRVLPTIVLGDPLQAIFGFGGNKLVGWKTHVEEAFPSVGQLSTPYRWIKAGHESFGRWLLDMRTELLAERSIDLAKAHKNVTWISLDGSDDFATKLRAGMTKAPIADGKVLVIAASMDRGGRKRRQYASRLPGAVVAEAVDMGDLVDFGENFRLTDPAAVETLAQFAEQVMTNISAEDFTQRVDRIRAGKNRKPAIEAEQRAVDFANAPSYTGAAAVLDGIAAMGGVSVPRPAILEGCHSLLRSCDSGSSPYDAAVAVRERSRLIGRPLSARTVGSTLLLKGLEAEVSVILDVDDMDANHLYVAATRGSHALVVCSTARHVP